MIKLRSGAVVSAWLCDLTEARTAASILHAVATALGVPPTSMDSDISSLSKDIGRTITRCGSTLLIVDNAEQVIDVLAPLLRDWLEQAPQPRFVLTSLGRAKRIVSTCAGWQMCTAQSLTRRPIGGESPSPQGSPSGAKETTLWPLTIRARPPCTRSSS